MTTRLKKLQAGGRRLSVSDPDSPDVVGFANVTTDGIDIEEWVVEAK